MKNQYSHRLAVDKHSFEEIHVDSQGGGEWAGQVEGYGPFDQICGD